MNVRLGLRAGLDLQRRQRRQPQADAIVHTDGLAVDVDLPEAVGPDPGPGHERDLGTDLQIVAVQPSLGDLTTGRARGNIVVEVRAHLERPQTELRAQAVTLQFLEFEVLHAALDAQGDVLLAPAAAIMEPEITAGRPRGVVDDAALQVDRAVAIELASKG